MEIPEGNAVSGVEKMTFEFIIYVCIFEFEIEAGLRHISTYFILVAFYNQLRFTMKKWVF